MFQFHAFACTDCTSICCWFTVSRVWIWLSVVKFCNSCLISSYDFNWSFSSLWVWLSFVYFVIMFNLLSCFDFKRLFGSIIDSSSYGSIFVLVGFARFSLWWIWTSFINFVITCLSLVLGLIFVVFDFFSCISCWSRFSQLVNLIELS